MLTWGILCGTWYIKSATGATFNEVPMTSNKSTFPLSSSSALSKWSESFSPKKVMFGYGIFRTADRFKYKTCDTFITPFGSTNPSSSLSPPPSQAPLWTLFFLPFFFSVFLPALVQATQYGTSFVSIAASMDFPGTLRWQSMHEAVAKEPWHWITRVMPVAVSRVSMFCV